MTDSQEQFDYIIVGAGSAGCVLANRLSADPSVSVCLVEAGGRDSSPWIHIPLGYGKLFQNPKYNWMYESDPEPHMNNRVILQPRGKVLGGSSSINGLVYIRGQQEDFNQWRDLGNAGWGFDDVLPYFIRSEDQQRGASQWHGVGGPQAVSDQREPHPLCDAFIDAADEMGIPKNPDFNGERQLGAGYFQTTSRNGRRISTAQGYLKQASQRPNLTIKTHCHTHRVLLEGTRASGIEISQGGQRSQLKAHSEVILCAGAIGSPQLLQLSGIGNQTLLNGKGITVQHHLPGVGENLQDHLQVRSVYRCKQPVTMNDDMKNWWRQALVGLRYLLQRKGPLTVSAGYAGAFFNSSDLTSRPDVQSHFILFSTSKMGTALDNYSGFTASICQLRPESRGTCHIQSADAFQAPSIKLNYLAHETDQQVTVAGLQKLRAIMQQPAMEAFVAEEKEPGAKVVSDEDVLAYCRDKGVSIYHPSGTAKMGRDDMAVVDERLSVHGLSGLRVVDASIMPTLVSGNCNAAIIMIAEKAADMIREDRNL